MLRLQSVPVFVSNQDRSLAFYRDKLGFTVLSDTQLAPGARWIMLSSAYGGAEIILYQPNELINGADADKLRARIGTWTGIVILTDDIQETYRALKSEVHFLSEPELKPWRVVEACFHDPDGNVFHLVERRSDTFAPSS